MMKNIYYEFAPFGDGGKIVGMIAYRGLRFAHPRLCTLIPFGDLLLKWFIALIITPPKGADVNSRGVNHAERVVNPRIFVTKKFIQVPEGCQQHGIQNNMGHYYSPPSGTVEN